MYSVDSTRSSCHLPAFINPQSTRGKVFQVFLLVAAAGSFIALGATLVFSWPVALGLAGGCLLFALIQLGRCGCAPQSVTLPQVEGIIEVTDEELQECVNTYDKKYTPFENSQYNGPIRLATCLTPAEDSKGEKIFYKVNQKYYPVFKRNVRLPVFYYVSYSIRHGFKLNQQYPGFSTNYFDQYGQQIDLNDLSSIGLRSKEDPNSYPD